MHTNQSQIQLLQVLTKTTPPPQGYPRVPGSWEVSLEPKFRGLVLNHQVLIEPEAKKFQRLAMKPIQD